MSSYTTLPYKSPRCVVCGRDLPKGRRLKCYICRPPKPQVPAPQMPPEESKKERYTIEDCVALSVAYGISYGNVVAIIENQLKWPTKKRPIVWPEGSIHVGEK